MGLRFLSEMIEVSRLGALADGVHVTRRRGMETGARYEIALCRSDQVQGCSSHGTVPSFSSSEDDTMKRYFLIATAVLAACTLPALANDANFERTLTVSGHAELSVATGSGYIHITSGSGNQIHIVGKVHSNWGSNDDRVREIAANPPIEQTGNIVRIGERH